MESTHVKAPGSNQGLGAAFRLKSNPLPWRKALGAPAATLLAVALGLAFGHLEYGVWAFFGAFTSMYVTGVPYRIRARVLAAVGLGLVASLAVGSATASSPFALTVGLGLVSGLATFVTVAFDVPLPGSLMFILIAVLGAALPIHPDLTLLRTAWAAVGAAIAWVVGMVGATVHPGRPEQLLLSTLFQDLSQDADREGTGNPHQRSRATLTAAVRMWRAGCFRSPIARRWLLRAARVYRVLSRDDKRHRALAAHLRLVAAQLRDGDARSLAAARPARFRSTAPVRLQLRDDGGWLKVFDDRRFRIKSAFRAGSAARTAAIRTGVAVTLATALALLLGEAHPYWVPLTVGAILQGPTPGVMMDRAVERVVGTALGLFLAGSLLVLHFGVAVTVALMLVLQFLLLLVVVRNYALSVIFITTLALVVIEGQVHAPLWPLLVARLGNTALGAALAVAALLLTGSRERPHAALRVPRPVPSRASPVRHGRREVR
ncbi:MAG: FUSC family protein [Clostridia bacterium]